MKKILLKRLTLLAIAAAASSCAYDPYYTSSSISYSSGYGDGYGYGGSGFTTTYFVSTGDPRWGYDPYCHSYYDYRSRRYYDPYLYGYYPVGYRPVAVVGVPHPYGWRQGSRHCPPPRVVKNVTVVNYRDREAAYRRSHYSWAGNVRRMDTPESRRHDFRKGEHDSFRRTNLDKRREPRPRGDSRQLADTHVSTGFPKHLQNRENEQPRSDRTRRPDRMSREVKIDSPQPPAVPDTQRESRRMREPVMPQPRQADETQPRGSGREPRQFEGFRQRRELRQERGRIEREDRQREPMRGMNEPRGESRSMREAGRKLRGLGEG